MTGLARTATATRMAFRDQRRRPLVIVLLVALPAYVVARSIAQTEPTPRRISVPGGLEATTTMQELHGAVMAGGVIAFVAGLVGVFVMESALAGDRRLVVAGFTPGETIAARLAVVVAAVAVALAASVAATAAYFDPRSWPPLVAGLALTGLIYAAIGALSGALLDRLAATYVILFAALTDVTIVQNPMFGDGTPGSLAVLLPGYGPVRMMVDGGFSGAFGAQGELALGIAWTVALGAAVTACLRRAVRRGG
ncbi:MAG TPA: hypothetical protein VK919_10315 [Solirubrobacterales bacterium]|nr:hypothetical protein [Solirubrobacterales bacterium]